MPRLLPRTAALVALFAAACADAQGEAADGFPDLSARQAGAFAVTEAARSGEDAPFARITGIDVDSRGRIFVGDGTAARISVLDPDARLVTTWGRKGLGPGEFRSVGSVQVLRGDSVLAFDGSAGRLTVFSPDGAAAYVVNLSRAGLTSVGRLPDDGGYVGITLPRFRDGAAETQVDEVLVFDSQGSVRPEPLRVFPARSYVHVQQGGSFSIMPNPFGSQAFLAIGSEAVYLAWGDTLGVRAFDGSGTQVAGFSTPYEPPQVTSADVRRLLDGYPQQMAQMFGRALADSATGRWPALGGLVADDSGRVWLAISSPVGTPSEWAVFDATGGYGGSVFLPAGSEIQAIRGGRIYSTAEQRSRLVLYRAGARARGRSN